MRRALIRLVVVVLGFSAAARADEPGREQRAGRIAILLGEIASGARQMESPDLRLACQLQAAGLLWDRDPDGARRVFGEAFEWVSMAPPGGEADRRLVAALLSATARRDPALAESFVRRLEILDQRAAPGTAPADRAAALADAGIEMLPGDPARAAEFARAALAAGMTVPAVRLLVVLRGVDAARADAVFAAALADALRPPGPGLDEAATASSYFLASGGARPEGVPPEIARAFLDHTARLISLAQPDAPEAPAAYFLGRQLAGLFQTQLPGRAAEVAARVALLSQSDRVTAPRGRTEAYGRWLDGDAPEDPRVAASVRLARQGRYGEAQREMARVQSPERRVAILLGVSRAALSKDQRARAVEAAGDAERECLRVRDPAERAPLLFRLAAACAPVDQVLAFSALRGGVDALNAAARALDAPDAARAARPDFGGAFEALAGEDFDGALLLARRLDGRRDRLFAQLAVCRGGLGADPEGED